MFLKVCFCFITISFIFVLDSEAIRKYLHSKAFKTGRRTMMNEEPENSFNLIMGQIILTLWEFVDCLNLMNVPKNPTDPLALSPWLLSDFVPDKVSPSGTRFRFPLL